MDNGNVNDTIAAARALIEPLTGYTPGPWVGVNMVHADHGGPMTPEEIAEYVCNCVKLGDPNRFLFVSGDHDDGSDADICHTGNGPRGPANTRLIAAAPDLRDMVATLADALEAERVKVAAAYETAAALPTTPDWRWRFKPSWSASDFAEAVRALTPADAQAALDKLLAEARLVGWWAGREAAAAEAALYGCSEGADEYTEGIHVGYTDAVGQIVDGIRALPEPKENNND